MTQQAFTPRTRSRAVGAAHSSCTSLDANAVKQTSSGSLRLPPLSLSQWSLSNLRCPCAGAFSLPPGRKGGSSLRLKDAEQLENAARRVPWAR
jgi:hypothetical protein